MFRRGSSRRRLAAKEDETTVNNNPMHSNSTEQVRILSFEYLYVILFVSFFLGCFQSLCRNVFSIMAINGKLPSCRVVGATL
jgi:hypothetical protein